MSVIYTWIYNATGGSAFPVILHASTNVASAHLAPALMPQRTRTLLCLVVAAGITPRYGPTHLSADPGRPREERVVPERLRGRGAVPT